MPYISHGVNIGIGLTLNLGDGTTEVLSSVYFMRARLGKGNTVLKLYYSFCDVEITGERLDIVLKDIACGHTGELSIGKGTGYPSSNKKKITCTFRE
jgi:hypothetical protein